MNNKNDIRWIQRLDSFNKAFFQLEEAVMLSRSRELSRLEKQGLIQAFEFTHELAWKTIKDFFAWQGNSELYGSKDAVREAFNYGLIEDGELWMGMIKKRNESSHTYNDKTAEEIYTAITVHYYFEFRKFGLKMTELAQKEQ